MPNGQPDSRANSQIYVRATGARMRVVTPAADRRPDAVFELARKHSSDALRVVINLINDPEMPLAVRLFVFE